MQGKVEICGINTAKLKVLSSAETQQLLLKCQQGDKKAREELIQGNLRLVLSVVQRFVGRGESADDLFQVGCVGLIKSIDHFDTTLNVRFSTYAVPMIIGEIRRYLRDSAYKALMAREKFTSEHQREPTVEEIAHMLGMKREEVVFALDAIADPISLYDPIYQEGGDAICVMDQMRDPKNTDDSWIEQIAMKQAMGDLTDREKRILALRFYDGKTQIEVAKEIGISQAQVSRLEKGVIEKIKRQL